MYKKWEQFPCYAEYMHVVKFILFQIHCPWQERFCEIIWKENLQMWFDDFNMFKYLAMYHVIGWN